MKVKNVLAVAGSILTGAVVGGTVVQKLENTILQEKIKKVDKFKGYYNLLNQWLALKQEGKSIDKYFKDKGINKVAIYGMGEIGNRLYYDLKNTRIEVKYAVDKNAAGTYAEIDILEIGDNLPDVDAMVVTATFAFDEIKKEISSKVNCPIVSLEDVVYGI